MKRAIVILVLAAACGGKDKDAQCQSDLSDFKDCGGDLSGTWKALSACTKGLTTNPFDGQAGCEKASETMSSSSISGTVTFKDGTETDDLSITDTVQMSLPASCLSALDSTGTATPRQLCSAITSQFPGKGSCHFASETCACTLSLTLPEKGSTSYTIQDNHIVETGSSPSAGGAGTAYCVKDGRLMLFASAETVSGLIEFER